MPMIRARYSPEWEELALTVKQEANWTCEQCKRPCRIKGETLHDFIQRIKGIPHPDLDWVNQTAVSTICDHPQRFTLTVAHLDQDSSNDDRKNLKALCSGCHLKYDAPHRAENSRKKQEFLGQLSLLEEGARKDRGVFPVGIE